MALNNLIFVSYTTIKSEFASKSLRMYYTLLLAEDGVTTAGYNIFALGPNYGLNALITSGSDITDFEANYKPGATSVGSDDEAIARSQLPQLTSVTLPTSSSGRAFGYLGTSATTTVTVRATVYTPPGNNAQRSIKSANANDTAAGTGARTVMITYLDASCAGPFTETIALNGTTAVNTVNTNIALIERMDVVTVGSGGGNAGLITLNTGLGGAGGVIGTIAAGDNQTFWCHHYVPAGKTGFILTVEGGSTVTVGGLTPNWVNPINANAPQKALDLTIRHGTTFVFKNYGVPISVSGPAILFLNETPAAATASTIFASFAWMQQ
jgi:hypothetical protein